MSDPVNGFRVSEGGGLFAANTEKYRTSIIVPPAIHFLKSLSAEVVIPQAMRSEADLSRHLRALELWSMARAVGSPFAAQRKAAAISALLDEIVRVLCGHEWWHYEQSIRARHNSNHRSKKFYFACKTQSHSAGNHFATTTAENVASQ